MVDSEGASFMSSILIVVNKLSTTASCGSVSDVPPMMIDMCGALVE